MASGPPRTRAGIWAAMALTGKPTPSLPAMIWNLEFFTTNSGSTGDLRLAASAVSKVAATANESMVTGMSTGRRTANEVTYPASRDTSPPLRPRARMERRSSGRSMAMPNAEPGTVKPPLVAATRMGVVRYSPSSSSITLLS